MSVSCVNDPHFKKVVSKKHRLLLQENFQIKEQLQKKSKEVIHLKYFLNLLFQENQNLLKFSNQYLENNTTSLLKKHQISKLTLLDQEIIKDTSLIYITAQDILKKMKWSPVIARKYLVLLPCFKPNRY